MKLVSNTVPLRINKSHITLTSITVVPPYDSHIITF